MPLREENSQVGQTSQLSENRAGTRSFSSPSEISKGGGSELGDKDFGTLGQSARRQQERAELNQKMNFNRKKERAVRIGYRRLIKKGDGAGALRLLQEAEDGGVNPFGIRVEGQRAREASGQISSKRAQEVRGGTRKLEPDRDSFQQGFGQTTLQQELSEFDSPAGPRGDAGVAGIGEPLNLGEPLVPDDPITGPITLQAPKEEPLSDAEAIARASGPALWEWLKKPRSGDNIMAGLNGSGITPGKASEFFSTESLMSLLADPAAGLNLGGGPSRFSQSSLSSTASR